MRTASGLQSFTGDGSTTVFAVNIPSQPDTNYNLVTDVEYVSGVPDELTERYVKNLNMSNFRMIFKTPPQNGTAFNVHWMLAGA